MPTALVLGGTSGVGLATARQLVERQATVHIAGRDKAKLDAIAATDPELVGHQLDASDAAATEALAQRLAPIDWLVITLSGGEGMGPLADLDLDVLRRAFDAKFWAHLTAIKAAGPHLAGNASITLVSAISARGSMPGTAGIAALNAAVEGLIKPLAVELGPIRVNAVSPGLIDTPWWDKTPAEVRDQLFGQAEATLPSRHIATAADVAEAVVLCATNPNVTGTVLETDGGFRLASIA